MENFNKEEEDDEEDEKEDEGLFDREDDMDENDQRTTNQYQTNEETVLLETAGFLPLAKIAQ